MQLNLEVCDAFVIYIATSVLATWYFAICAERMHKTTEVCQKGLQAGFTVA